MLKTILLAVVLLVALVLIYAATRPGSFRLERSTVIAAPPDKVFALISDLRQFNTWNPFAKIDPDQQITYEAVTAGPGAAYRWVSTKSGAGRMEITEVQAPQRVAIKLDFSKPFEAHNQVEFTIAADGAGSRVTWAMFGPMAYLNKLISVFVSMDKMVGGDFERGLANLKAMAEAR